MIRSADAEERADPSLGAVRARTEGREGRFLEDWQRPGNWAITVFLAEKPEALANSARTGASGASGSDRNASRPTNDMSWASLDPAVLRRERRKRMQQAWDTAVTDFKVHHWPAWKCVERVEGP